MTDYVAPLEDMRFILFHLTDLPPISEPGIDADDTADLTVAILEEAAKFSQGVLAPLNQVGDREGCSLVEGKVATPRGWKQAYRQFRESGWVGLAMPVAYGGQGLPKLLSTPVTEMWFGSNLAFSVLPPMAVGAVETLLKAANEEIKSRYIPPLVEGRWTAAMDLTESGSGTDLSAIKTRAELHSDGTYRIFGQKIFITYGDHDVADNVIHLVLARLPDALPGARGISLFLVPKYLVRDDGALGPSNDVECIAIEHKLGIRGSPTCTMNYGSGDGAVGYLVGEAGRGLENMFVMVNDSRFNVGLQGIAVAELAFQKARAYAHERRQGKDSVTGEANIMIARHPDVKRNLLVMRAYIMAARMLSYAVAGLFDRSGQHHKGADPNRGVFDLLIPVIKGWSSEIGTEVANMGLQVHGGMGFVEETGAAQCVRDVRITSIYEGTTAIQANDLIQRKLLRDSGLSAKHLVSMMRKVQDDAAPRYELANLNVEFGAAIDLLEAANDWILAQSKANLGEVLAGATSFLRLVGVVCGAWQMLRASLAALQLISEGEGQRAYLDSMLNLAKVYYRHILPQAQMHSRIVLSGGSTIIASDVIAI